MVTTFLPLVPALFIFGRKLYLQEPLNFLLIYCLLGFFKEFLELVHPLAMESQQMINKLFSLGLLLLLVQCFRANLDSRRRYGTDILLSAVLATALTYWTIRGWQAPAPGIDLFFNIFLGIIILLSLPAVIRTGALQVFRSPLFWISGGALFYILLYLLLEGTTCCRPVYSAADPDKRLFLILADLVKYLLFLVAALSSRRQEGHQEGRREAKN